MDIITTECELFGHLFSEVSPIFRAFVETLAIILSDILRPTIIRCKSLDILCSMIDLLKSEIVKDIYKGRALSITIY